MTADARVNDLSLDGHVTALEWSEPVGGLSPYGGVLVEDGTIPESPTLV